jgi:hypothetical protein
MIRSHRLRAFGALALVAALAVPLATPASAQRWDHRGGYDRGRGYEGNRGYGRDNSGAVIGGALLGLGVGALVGGAYLAQPRVYAAPPPVYYAPPPVYYAPPPRAYYAPPPPVYYGY